ncbi:unnamed protein product [Lactuca saligna]|uniref:Cyclic nucleotide-binding domain-containing protein n=1 Tax=Lactuca saligna TaxID=75948 RepID=A0AA35YQ80_LACSI|nr:unnamed protein product [Lactuca saligna]
MFEIMDERLLDVMCDCSKPVLYTENSCIVREGDPVDDILFVMHGELLTMTTNGGRSGFFNSSYLKAGDFCGDELLMWALDPNLSSTLLISTRTAKPLTDVEGFALKVEHLRFVASQFRRLHSRHFQHTFRWHGVDTVEGSKRWRCGRKKNDCWKHWQKVVKPPPQVLEPPFMRLGLPPIFYIV